MIIDKKHMVIKRISPPMISEHRTELMGLGAIGVLITHSSGIVSLPSFLSPVVTYGGLGVYFFMFLSGLGLFYAFSKRGGVYRKTDFYKKRFQRVIVPYLIIAGIWYGIKYLAIEHDVLSFAFELSTLSYWLKHQGAWFVAALIPIYLLYPFYYEWAEKDNRWVRNLLALGGFLIAEICVYNFNKPLYDHIGQVLNGVWMFMLGHMFGSEIMKKNKKILCMIPVFLILFMADKCFPLYKCTPIRPIIYGLKGLLLLIVLTYCLQILNSRLIQRVLTRIGNASLELYLSNIFCIQALRYFSVDKMIAKVFPNEKEYVCYGVVVLAGVILAFLSHWLMTKYLNRSITTA